MNVRRLVLEYATERAGDLIPFPGKELGLWGRSSRRPNASALAIHDPRDAVDWLGPPTRRQVMLKEFKEFAVKGNVLDMAVGIIVGAAFGTVVQSLVKDVIMPPIGLVLGGVDFTNLFVTIRQGSVAGPYATLVAAQEAGAVTLNYGVFANAIISFVIVAFAVFLLVRSFNKLRRQEEAAPTAPPAPPADVVLLGEIRDLLKARG
jgi:large conductance mechanosensitive channel